jgi:hypothetical protein
MYIKNSTMQVVLCYFFGLICIVMAAPMEEQQAEDRGETALFLVLFRIL